MNKGSTAVVSGGTSFCGLLQLVFIVLKLCKVIKWSWWIVLIPLWVYLGLMLITIIMAIIIACNE